MAVRTDLSRIAELSAAGARRALDELLRLGPRPRDVAEALLWDQVRTRLQGQINSLAAIVSKLTAAAIVDGLEHFSGELAIIGEVAADARAKMDDITSVSDFLTKAGAILDLGTAILALATTPSGAALEALRQAGEVVRGSFSGTEEDEALA